MRKEYLLKFDTPTFWFSQSPQSFIVYHTCYNPFIASFLLSWLMMFILKSIRVLFALLIFLVLLAFFFDFLEIVPRQLHVLAHIQLTPALLNIGAMSGIVITWVVLTFLFGRIYCSAICPLGIMQDFFARITKWIRRKKYKLQFQPEMKSTRYAFLALFIIGLAGLPVLVSLLDPYSHFGRIVMWMFRPLLIVGNNALAENLVGQFQFVPNHVSGIALTITLIAFLIVTGLAILAGRRYCNTVCPVGTLLGIIARYSLLRVRIGEHCKSCRLCEKTCKGECIDGKAKTVDSSRCVACFNCHSVCKQNAIGYGLASPKLLPILEKAPVPIVVESGIAESGIAESGQISRRTLLSWSVLACLLPSALRAATNDKQSAAALEETMSSLPRGTSVVGYTMNDPVLPPGAESIQHYRRHCTGCHLCITKCPANVLTPAVTELGLAGFLQPIMKFNHGFCNYDCTICAEVCPSHAIESLTMEQKHLVQSGEVVFLQENCVVETQGTNCGACGEHCPTGAITMVPFGDPGGLLAIPKIDKTLCIGCGACEYICPVSPYKAIYVKGLAKQGEAKLAYDPNEKQKEVKLDDFGF